MLKNIKTINKRKRGNMDKQLNNFLTSIGDNTIKNECESFETTLKKAAIQFPFFNTTVSSCILGMNSSNQVIENLEDYSRQLPSNFWKYLKDKKLIDERSQIN